MPVLIVYGMPNGEQRDLEKLIDWLQRAVGSSLMLAPSEVSVFFPVDIVQRGLGEELVCIIEGLFERSERTPNVRQALSEIIRDELRTFARKYLPQCVKIEVMISRFNQNADGFAVWKLS